MRRAELLAVIVRGPGGLFFNGPPLVDRGANRSHLCTSFQGWGWPGRLLLHSVGWPVDTDAMPPNANSEPTDKPAAKPRPKRRWYQFSLRAMFVWVTVVAVLLTVGHNEDRPGDGGGSEQEPLEL